MGIVGYFFATGDVEGLVRSGSVVDALLWTGVIAVVELLPVPAWKSVQISIGFPLLMAVAFIYQPGVAGVIAFLGSSDPREFKGEVGPLHALFNRSQISLSVFIASLAFHSLGGSSLAWPVFVLPALAAVLADYSVNAALVSMDASLMHGVPLGTVFRKLRIGNPMEFLVSYIGLGFLGVMLARFFQLGGWAVAAFVMPLLLARQMFFRTRALEDAAKQLRDREVVLRALSNRMAEERQDERMQIAGYLHDDLAQLLYRMSLHIDISEKHLGSGEAEKVREELGTIRDTKDRTLKMVRSLIKDLHRSPLGRAGLVEAIGSFCIDLEGDTGMRFLLDLEEVDMPAPIQLLCYQVSREAIMNIVKHAQASTVRVTLRPTDDGARVTIADDGIGFDVEAGSPEGHFGLTMMRERAQISGGSLTIESTPGEGSVVTAEFKTAVMSDLEETRALGLGGDTA